MKKIAVLPLVLTLLVFSVKEISAQGQVQSPNFRIEWPNLNSGAGIPSSTNYKLDSTIGQTAPGLYSSAGFRVKAGFQYIHSIIPFSFSVSDIRRDFGTLTPGTPATLSATLVVSAGGAGGYSVKASENHPLQLPGGGTNIIDTLCDSGPCSETTAFPWTLNTTYGFGFNMTGDDIPADFTNSTYFRQFADRSGAETEQTIMSSAVVGRSRTSVITFKVNISNIQGAGTYRNIVQFNANAGY